jgi:hypothetical protein
MRRLDRVNVLYKREDVKIAIKLDHLSNEVLEMGQGGNIVIYLG